MRILLTTDVIHAGGAETFVLRLGQALTDRGHQVVITPLYKQRIDQKILKVLAPGVRVVPLPIRMLRSIQVLDGLLRRTGIDYSFLTQLFSKRLAKIIKVEQVQLVHSHLFTADIIATAAGKATGVPVVTTIHGDYNNYHRMLLEGKPIPFLNYPAMMRRVLRSFAHVVYISDVQLRFLSEQFSYNCLPLEKIYNGYNPVPADSKINKQILGIPEGYFVFGMVARGIPEKGWEEAITAFLKLEVTHACLVMVGYSSYVAALQKKYAYEPRIIFAGYTPNSIVYIRYFDVAVFTSTYYSESLPTVIIEYLSCKVPVIAVDVAECRNMMDANGRTAGILVPLKNGKVDVKAVSNAMLMLQQNETVLQQFKLFTTKAYSKFSMKDCVRRYESLYKNAISLCVP